MTLLHTYPFHLSPVDRNKIFKIKRCKKKNICVCISYTCLVYEEYVVNTCIEEITPNH